MTQHRPPHDPGQSQHGDRLVSSLRARTALPFLAIGGVCVIAGGLLAAVTAHSPSQKATWASAYLVLVAGVAQILLGAGQAWLAEHRPLPRWFIGELIAWNLGHVAVIAGAVSRVTPVTDIGGVLLVVALVLLLTAVRGSHSRGWLLLLYRALIVIVLVSIPIGLVLAEVRAA